MSTYLSKPEKPIFARSEMLLGACAALLLGWLYWPSLVTLTGRWGIDSDYSHGFLVPLFSLFLLWKGRKALKAGSLRSSWWGLPLLGLGLCLRLASVYLYFDWLQAISLLPCLAGLCLLVGGWSALRWSGIAIAFLVFMVPLPFRFETALAHPLQRVATSASTYLVQTLGFAAFSEGNIIRLGEYKIGVTEACSGLSMLVVFFALSTAVAILIRRPLLDKMVTFLSAIPIALAANIVRVTATAVLYKLAGEELAHLVFHDLAGWLMMPLGLALLWTELLLLSWVLIPRSRSSKRRATGGAMILRDLQPASAASLGAAPRRSPVRADAGGSGVLGVKAGE
jgi:exosortase